MPGMPWWDTVVLKRGYQRAHKPWQPVPESRRCCTPGAGFKPGNLVPESRRCCWIRVERQHRFFLLGISNSKILFYFCNSDGMGQVSSQDRQVPLATKVQVFLRYPAYVPSFAHATAELHRAATCSSAIRPR